MQGPRGSASWLFAATLFAVCTPPPGQNWSYERLLCIYRVGAQQGALAEAQTELRRLGAGDAEHPWPTLVLAYATQSQDEARAIDLYQRAADGFAHTHEVEGEVLARHNLHNAYRRRGQFAAAAAQVERAVAVADASHQPLPMARAAVLEASHLIETGGDLGRAYRSLVRAQRFAFPSGPIGLRRTILFNLANASLYLGRLDDAIDALERHRALRQEDGSTAEAATVAFNLLNARLTKSEMRPRAGARQHLTVDALRVLDEVQRLDSPALIAHTHRVLADLLRASDPAAAGMHAARCLELATTLKYPELRATCLWSQSRTEAMRDRTHAEDLSRQAVAALAGNPDGPLLAYAWQSRLRLVWQTAISEEEQQRAIGASLEALDAIERLRTAQKDDSSRAALFSNWTGDYRYLTGRLLTMRTPQLSRAFEVGERLRARVLLEHLVRAGVASASGAGASASTSDASAFASLAQVQQTLDDDEAMLWFSIAPSEDMYGEFGGGAWALAVRRDAITVHRVSIGVELDSQVAAFVGLLRDRATAPERWEQAADHLGHALLGDAIATLPANIRRLVIVSDGDLHRLPFEVLRAAPGQPRVGERFEIAVVPSATVWRHLRHVPAPPVANTALVLADPELPPSDLGLQRLPWARHEARAIARALWLDAGRVREGSAASERFLKQTPLANAAVLHIAAHARADEASPDRSAIFLAPGDGSEDGLLQPREIASLGLRGQLVVLSACDSAGGFLLSGEGPLSLARAFFAGGAGAVVATRWPLRDDDAAFVMDRFYRALASGSTVGAALGRARRDAVDAKRPAAAWAGLVLLGDGGRRPYPDLYPHRHHPDPRPQPRWWYGLALAAFLGVIIVLASFQLRHGRRSHARGDTRGEG